MADQEQEWNSRNHFHAKSRQSSDGRQYAHPRRGCVGARVLPEISKPPGRLPQGVVERRQLGHGCEKLLRIAVAGILVGTPRAATSGRRSALSLPRWLA